MEKGLMVLDVSFHAGMSAVDGIIDKGRLAAFKVGDHKAHTLFCAGDFHLADNPPCCSPAFCLIEKRGEQADSLLGAIIQLSGLFQQAGSLSV